MKEVENQPVNWCVCPQCQGQGKKRQKLSKKARLRHQSNSCQDEETRQTTPLPTKPLGAVSPCSNCHGTGLIQTEHPLVADTKTYPHVAIIGGGIGGVALAVACLHRGIPFTLFERDTHFNARAQGYGLTLQQATKTIVELGVISLTEGITSTKHVVHTAEGNVVGEWGMRKWLPTKDTEPTSAVPSATLTKSTKRSNIHIARQALRAALLDQLGGSSAIQWGHQLLGFKENNGRVDLNFRVNGVLKQTTTDLVVGADGIRSCVRKLLIGDTTTPLHYLDCMVILGICPLSALDDLDSPLLDSATVFQTANGQERMYMMPYTSNAIMWQFSFPISEEKAKQLSSLGAKALKAEVLRRTPWHAPIPQIVSATLETQISGYPVYDRELLNSELLKNHKQVTLLGDAAHPMSPFKGQGANQALLDALALARGISKGCKSTTWNESNLRTNILTDYESEMISRSATKVKESANAAHFLHTKIALIKGDKPRGSCIK